ncbi:MAG: hypothetical protein R2822_04860 [Spirosomataceae bacterium]
MLLLDVATILALNGTMQYKVHEWLLNWINGRILYELDEEGKSAGLNFVFMTVRKCFKMAVSEYLYLTKKLRFNTVLFISKVVPASKKVIFY